MVGDGVDLGVPPPAEDGRFLLRQQGLDSLRLLRLGLGADQPDGGAVHPPSRGPAVGAEPGADQQLKHRVPHVGQADGADFQKAVPAQLRVKVVFHSTLLILSPGAAGQYRRM